MFEELERVAASLFVVFMAVSELYVVFGGWHLGYVYRWLQIEVLLNYHEKVDYEWEQKQSYDSPYQVHFRIYLAFTIEAFTVSHLQQKPLRNNCIQRQR